MSAATMNMVEELRRERDLALRDYEVMNKLREGAEQERDAALEREQALAASLERIVDAWMYDDTGIHDKYAYGVMLPVARYEGVNKAIMDSRLKGFSLKKRDLIKQAEALEYVSGQYAARGLGVGYIGQDISKHVTTLAKKYRQQASAL